MRHLGILRHKTPMQAYVPACKLLHSRPPTTVFQRTNSSVEVGPLEKATGHNARPCRNQGPGQGSLHTMEEGVWGALRLLETPCR